MHPCPFTLITITVLVASIPGQQFYVLGAAESSSVSDNPHEFKIFTFHRDEDELLQDWVKHHARIVGRSNIYILDNNSTSPTALRDLDAMRKVGDATAGLSVQNMAMYDLSGGRVL